MVSKGDPKNIVRLLGQKEPISEKSAKNIIATSENGRKSSTRRAQKA